MTQGATEQQTAFSKAWADWKERNASSLNPDTIGPGPYLENRLFLAFSAGWRASALECVALLKVKV